MYDLIVVRLRRYKHDIASRLPVSCVVIEMEQTLFNWENR